MKRTVISARGRVTVTGGHNDSPARSTRAVKDIGQRRFQVVGQAIVGEAKARP